MGADRSVLAAAVADRGLAAESALAATLSSPGGAAAGRTGGDSPFLAEHRLQPASDCGRIPAGLFQCGPAGGGGILPAAAGLSSGAPIGHHQIHTGGLLYCAGPFVAALPLAVGLYRLSDGAAFVL